MKVNSNQTNAIHVVTIGCKDLAETLPAAGYIQHDYSDFETPLNSSEGIMPRLVLINASSTSPSASQKLVTRFRKKWPFVDIVFWASDASGKEVLDLIKAGAKDVCLSRNSEEVLKVVDQVVHNQQILPRFTKRTKRKSSSSFHGMLSREPKMWDIFENVSQVAQTDANVLVLGETGTGKELIARAIHKESGRKGRFVAVNCAAIPENLIDSELFGHERGAFTGANTSKKGLFRYAEGGSIFLDEIGHMPLSSQYHLLRVLQEETVRPVGGHEEIPVNVRVIAATSSPLDQAIKERKFREDLFYRLDVMRIELLPLRERGDDVIFLFSQFIQKFCRQYKISFPNMNESFLDEIARYPWPGNVRQLTNIAERLILTKPNGNFTLRDFKRITGGTLSQASVRSQPFDIGSNFNIDLDKTMPEAIKPIIEKAEKKYLTELLKRHEGRVGVTAEKAGVNRRTILRKLKSWGMDRRDALEL